MIFSSASERMEVCLSRQSLQSVVARLMSEIRDDRIVPIGSSDQLQPGQELQPLSFWVDRAPIGNQRRLMIAVRVADRVLRIPLVLSPEQVEKLVAELE